MHSSTGPPNHSSFPPPLFAAPMPPPAVSASAPAPHPFSAESLFQSSKGLCQPPSSSPPPHTPTVSSNSRLSLCFPLQKQPTKLTCCDANWTTGFSTEPASPEPFLPLRTCARNYITINTNTPTSTSTSSCSPPPHLLPRRTSRHHSSRTYPRWVCPIRHSIAPDSDYPLPTVAIRLLVYCIPDWPERRLLRRPAIYHHSRQR